MHGLHESIKVAFPSTEDDFHAGVGERLRVLVGSGGKEAWRRGVKGDSWVGELDNDSIYYPTLKRGDLVEFELRGPRKAVANWGFLAAAAAEGGYDPAEVKQGFIAAALAHAL